MATATKFPPSQQLLREKQTRVTESFYSYTTFSLMWNNTKRAVHEEDDSWEVKAFEEDTGNILGATWPPRSYTCTFCGREFSSAQALGGHMNVHRRDRARLHQAPPGGSNKPPPPSAANASSFIIPPQEFVTNGGGGLCLLYSLPNPNGVLPPTTVNSCVNPPSTLLSISPCETNNIAQPCPSSMNFQLTPRSISSSACHSSNTEHSASITNDNNNQDNSESKKETSAIEEIDLELRLGRRSSSTP